MTNFDCEINQSQLNIIRNVIVQDQVMCVVLDSTEEEDTAEIRIDMASLAFMGLMTDWSDTEKFKPGIDYALKNNKRGYKVYGLTELCIMLFSTMEAKEYIN